MQTIMSVPTDAPACARLSDNGDDDALRLRLIFTRLGWPTFPGPPRLPNDSNARNNTVGTMTTMYPHPSAAVGVGFP